MAAPNKIRGGKKEKPRLATSVSARFRPQLFFTRFPPFFPPSVMCKASKMVQRFFPQLEKLLSQANPDLSLNFEAIETEVWSASMTAAPYSAQTKEKILKPQPQRDHFKRIYFLAFNFFGCIFVERLIFTVYWTWFLYHRILDL